MKRILGIVLLGLLLSGNADAGYGSSLSNLKLKPESTHQIYNKWIKDYFKFLDEIGGGFKKFHKNCKDSTISGNGLKGMLKIVDCEYVELRYLTKKYRLNTGDGGTTTINHNWYSAYYDLTIDWWNLSVGKSNSIINKRTQEYTKSMSANEKNWFRFFEMEIERAALDDNIKKYKELQN